MEAIFVTIYQEAIFVSIYQEAIILKFHCIIMVCGYFSKPLWYDIVMGRLQKIIESFKAFSIRVCTFASSSIMVRLEI